MWKCISVIFATAWTTFFLSKVEEVTKCSSEPFSFLGAMSISFLIVFSIAIGYLWRDEG